MNRFKTILLILGLLLTLSVSAQYQEDDVLIVTDDSLFAENVIDSLPPLPWPENLQARIDTLLITKLLDTSDIGLVIWGPNG